jgi:hypothetical protein
MKAAQRGHRLRGIESGGQSISMSGRPWSPTLVTHCAVAVILTLAIAGIGGCGIGHAAEPTATTRTCVYTRNGLSGLTTFDKVVRTHVSCGSVYDTSPPTWSAWEDPWFITDPIANENWVKFARTRGNEMIITVGMFPSQAESYNWRVRGADGAYTSYARTLARNLVANGMGHAVIRLGPEANGTWEADNIGTTTTDRARWRQFWRRTVLAMRSVPGAHFNFNWCIAAGIRPIPFADYYPGNDFVNSIGFDVYDENEPAGEQNSWSYQEDRPGGVAAIVAFAKAQHKPLSIPEWGLVLGADGGSGDYLQFVKGIENVVDNDDVSFEAYFFARGADIALEDSPRGLAVYRQMISAK